MKQKTEGPQRKRMEDLRGRLMDQLIENPAEQLEAQAEQLDPETEWEEKGTGKLGRNVVIGLGLFLMASLVAWGIFAKLTPPQERGRSLTPLPHFIEAQTSAEIQAEVERVLRGYMTAGSVEERARFVTGGAEVLAKMREYEAREGVRVPQGFEEVSHQFNFAVEGLPMIGTTAVDGEGRSWTIGLVPGLDVLHIDWESSVNYGEMNWSHFVKIRPEETQLMRVYLLRFINEDDRGLKDPPLYYRVSSPTSREQIIAVPARGSVVETDLKRAVGQGMRQPVTVRMRFHEGRPFAEITELVLGVWMDAERAERGLGR